MASPLPPAPLLRSLAPINAPWRPFGALGCTNGARPSCPLGAHLAPTPTLLGDPHYARSPFGAPFTPPWCTPGAPATLLGAHKAPKGHLRHPHPSCPLGAPLAPRVHVKKQIFPNKLETSPYSFYLLTHLPYF